MTPTAPRLALFVLLGSVATSSCQCDDELYGIPSVGGLRGVICADDDGQPRANVAVTLTDAEGVDHVVQSGEDGTFLADELPVGEIAIVIDDQPPREGRITIDEGAVVDFIDATCRPPPPSPTGSISGCVCDEGVGQWVTAANVFVTYADGGVVVTGTDERGCFLLEGVLPGAQTLQILKGVFVREQPVTVVAAETVAIPSPETCERDPPIQGETGSVAGRVCAPDGTTWLSAADVFVSLSGGARVATVTDGDGAYLLDGVPVGRRTVEIVKGSFSTTREVDVFAGQTTTIPEDECAIEAAHLRIAVVTGDYDRVQDVLSSIGIEDGDVDTYTSTFFDTGWVQDLVGNYEVLSQYDIVFLNCGLGDSDFSLPPFFDNDAAIANLRQFVSQGGSVYASDWAYYVVEKTWPDYIDFVGDDARSDNAKVGAVGDVDAAIVDVGMAQALGQSSMELHYPLISWAVIESAATTTTVYVRGDAPLDNGTSLQDVPHTVAFRPGQGRVLFTSFHQEPGINPDMQRVLQLLIFEL
jgi:hypothetical protein